MKRLFISDLDGTLLNNNKKISPFTKNILNEIINRDELFTIATARTAQTVTELLSGVNLKIPVILMNGVIVYDLKKNENIKVSKIPFNAAKKVIEIMDKFNKQAFMYMLDSDEIIVYHKELTNKFELDFYNGRVGRKYKKFIKVDDYSSNIKNEEVLYFAFIDDYKILSKIKNEIEKIEGISCTFYLDVYSKDHYYLEVFSSNATKSNAVLFLKEYLSADVLITFGDNHNDLDMLKASDYAYAVSNSIAEVIEVSDEVIDSNENDGVAKKILELM